MWFLEILFLLQTFFFLTIIAIYIAM
jgi:hypothetical protein